jgi:imidazolonepropionase
VLLLTNIAQLATLAGPPSPRRGRQLADIGLITDAAVLVSAGRIVAAGKQREMLRHPWYKRNQDKLREIDCTQKTVLPGFVDSHTHLIFTEPRLTDFEKRIEGASYEQIAKAGGGIRSSVAGVRAASRSKLAKKALSALQQMLIHGTTTVEAKSGYGLSVAAELKSLEAIREAAKHWPGTVVSTLLGAHVVPAEFQAKPDAYLREVCEKMIPAAAKRKLATFVDVFRERGAFSLADIEKVFAAAKKNGLRSRAHVGQFTSSALDYLLKYSPASFDHMDVVSDADLPALASSNTVCTLLPGANYFLGHTKYSDARKFIDAGVAVALATDYNPGTSPTLSMQFVLSLACTQVKMAPAEAISAATINGAHALLLSERKGSIEPGKDADLGIFDVSDYREICYWVGSNHCKQVIAGGEVIG